nr:hypothetical protein OG690_10270 [Streptomyces tubercidicus]
MDAQDFAAVLAQVIPVVVLALVVESRFVHTTRLDRGGSAADPQIVWDLVLQVGVLTFLVFLEVAALLTADGQGGPFLGWLAGPPGAVGVGILLVLMGRLYLDSVADTYARRRLIKKRWAKKLKRGAQVLMWLSAISGLALIGVFWGPWWLCIMAILLPLVVLCVPWL